MLNVQSIKVLDWPMIYKVILLLFFLPLQVFGQVQYAWLDNTHQKLSNKVLDYSESIDLWIANTTEDKKKNTSTLTVSFKTLVREGRGPVGIPEIDYRLLLPNTERKLNLIISQEDKDDDTSEAQSVSENSNATKLTDQTSAAVGYLFETAGIKYTIKTGVLVNIPIRIFSELTLSKDIELNKNWVLKNREVVKWVNTDGFYSDTDVDFERKLSDNLKFRFINNMFWDDQSYLVSFKHGPSLFQKIDNKRSLSYHAHFTTVSNPSWFVTNYILQIKYHQLLYKKWLFGSIEPFINFPKDKNFHRTPGLILNLDMIFGDV